MSKVSMEVTLAGVTLKNPVMTASGTFGSGMEYGKVLQLDQLGAVVTKGVSIEPWEGNPAPRIVETPSGMLNAVGLQNPGVDTFIERDLNFLKDYDTNIIVNVCGHSEEEYLAVVERLADQSTVCMLEINISCPNLSKGGLAFGTDANSVEEITKAIKRVAKQPVIMKLSPNVTSIADMAKAAEAGGADVISLINTLIGMKIDTETGKFVLGNRTGGLSGPAIHPIAVRMVYEASRAVSIPVIGMGGISSTQDAVEMMLAGATAVSVGTMNFYQPQGTLRIIEGLKKYLKDHGITDVKELIGAVKE